VSPEAVSLRDEIAQCERQLAQYRAALDAGGDPAIVGQWITETQARKLAAGARLRAQTSAAGAAQRRMSREDITSMINVITDTMTVLRHADPADKAELYARLGLRLTYDPGASPRTVNARAELGRSCTKGSCPRSESSHFPTAIRPCHRISAWHGNVSTGLSPNGRHAAERRAAEGASAVGWLELGLIYECDATAGLVPIVHKTFPPAIRSTPPSQQETVYPRPIRQNLTGLRVCGDVLGKAVEAFAEPGGHGNRQRDRLRRMGFLSVALSHAVSRDQGLACRLAMVGATVRGSPDPDGKTPAGGHAFRLAAPGGDLAVLATFVAGDTCHRLAIPASGSHF